MTWLLGLLTLAYLAAATASGLAMAKVFGGRKISHAERLAVYRHVIVNSWVLAICLGLVALATDHSLAELGLSGPQPERFGLNPLLAWLIVILGTAFVAFELIQIRRLTHNPDYRSEVWRQLSTPPTDFAIELLVPRTAGERRVFYLVAATAGICEEFIFRGILFAALGDIVPGISPYLAAVISAVLFGIPHAYQGWAGIGKTALAGLGFGLLYLASGTVVAPMILHGVVDLVNAHLYSGREDQPDQGVTPGEIPDDGATPAEQ